MLRLCTTTALLALLAIPACPKPSTDSGTAPAGEADPSAGGASGGSEPAPASPAPASDGPAPASDGPAPAGGSPPPAQEVRHCTTDADCGSGSVCEGQGCGAMEGVCASMDRMCTKDSQPYCGCDGQTFRSSGSCHGRRYSAKGACPSKGDGKPDGATCLAASECASGICEGKGCGKDQPGACAPKSRMCTRDAQQYCGCDGQTFRSSGSCPGRRFSAKGACPKG